jgi:hypothetical protein
VPGARGHDDGLAGLDNEGFHRCGIGLLEVVCEIAWESYGLNEWAGNG